MSDDQEPETIAGSFLALPVFIGLFTGVAVRQSYLDSDAWLSDTTIRVGGTSPSRGLEADRVIIVAFRDTSTTVRSFAR